MKRGKRLTREQKAIVLGNGLDPKEYMYVGVEEDKMVVVNITSGATEKINIHKRKKRI